MASDRGSKAPTSTTDRPPKRMAYGVDKWDTQITNQLRELLEPELLQVMERAARRMRNTLDMTIIEAISLELDPDQ